MKNARTPSLIGRIRMLPRLCRQAVAGLMSVMLALLPSTPAWSQIAANQNAPATQRPTILKTANGLPQVDIQTPNGAGVSMNRYSQFDVGKKGAILDNSRTDAKTQLGGWIKGNPWLAGGAAKVIVNQVDSSQPSRLNGYIEVAGQKADVVVANPSGITVDGGGFINARGVTLTTGVPRLGGDGSLSGFDVRGGSIAIGGAGLDASRTDYTALISRAVQVNASIWAKQLDITAGANHVAYGLDGAATAEAGSGSAPGIAIDVASLGSMYAHSIYLVGTDNGVGVSNAGVISADTGDLRLSANGQLTNTGLINGANTFIQAPTVSNLGGGRIYGGHLAIAAGTLNNGAQGGQAGTLAARDRLDLGVGTLNNTGGALIYSAGDLAIGGVLDTGHDATGSAGTVTNSSSSIESAGNLAIDAAVLNNLNATFATQVVDGQAHSSTEYYTPQGWIGSVSWMVDTSKDVQQCRLVGSPKNGYTQCSTVTVYAGTRLMRTGAAYSNPVFRQYFGTAAFVPSSTSGCENYHGGGDNSDGCTPTYTQGHANYSGTDPIWAVFGLTAPGYNLSLAPRFGNYSAWLQKAQPWIELQNRINALDTAVSNAPLYYTSGYYPNGAPTANLTYTYHDRIAQVTASKPGVIRAGGDMNLSLSQKLSNDESQILAGGALNVSGQQIDNLSHQIQANVTQTGTVNTWGVVSQHWGGWLNGMSYTYGWLHSAYHNVIPVTLTAPSVWKVRSHDAATHGGTGPSLPSASLYRLQPPGSAHLIETDPAFTDKRQWLSSDYMLKALSVNPATEQQRLGDGFYEQQLVNQQVARLTGQYALPGYGSTQSEYQALMDNGVSAAKGLGLHVGLALTAKQVSELTSNIVWLVDKTVTLPDGSTRTELAPQVYVAGQSGELKGDGTLIAGKSIDLKAGGTFTNSASLRAGGTLAASAKDIRNLGGDINATTVALAAQNDLNNIGGRIGAVDSLSLVAGHDLNLLSTTAQGSGHSATGQFSSTTLGRTATVYVSGANGTLTAQAGHDLTLQAAQVQADGAGSTASLAAGHDLALNAVTTHRHIDAKWSNSDLHLAWSKTVGSRISAGSVSLAAGNDLSATAARLKATDAKGTLALQAGHDIALKAGAQTSAFAASSAVSGGNALFGDGSLNRSFTTSTSTALGTRLSGAHIATVSGADTTVVGGRLNAADTLAMTAGGRLNLLAGTDRFSRSYLDSEGYGSTFAGQSTTKDSLSRTTAHGTQLNGGRIALQSGGDTTLQGAAISGQSLSVSAGRINGRTVQPNAQLNIDAAIQDYSHSHSDQSASLLTQGMDGRGTVKQTLHYTTITLHGGSTAQSATASDSGTATGQDTVPTPGAASGQGASSAAQPTFAATGGITVGASTLASAGSGTSKASGSGSGSGATPTRVVDLRRQAEKLASQPGMGYLKQLIKRKDVNWQKVQLAMQHWDYSQSGLTPAAAAIIAIVVTAVTAGAAAGAAGAMVSTATGASATATATSAAVTSALSTGMTTLASEAAVSLANNGGDVSKTLKDMGSKQSVRNLVTSMLTAGVDQGIGGSMATSAHLSESASFVHNTETGLMQATANAAVETAVEGGKLSDNLTQGWTNSMVQSALSSVQRKIGDLTTSDHLSPKRVENVFAHAVAGGLAAQAEGGKFASGAVAGASAALTDQAVGGSHLKKADQVSLERLIGAAAVLLTGGNAKSVEIGGQVAASAYQYNYLTHAQLLKAEQVQQTLDRCSQVGGNCSKQQVLSLESQLNAYKQLSTQQTAKMIAACAHGAANCSGLLGQAAAFEKTLQTESGLRNVMTGASGISNEGGALQFVVPGSDFTNGGGKAYQTPINVDALALNYYGQAANGSLTTTQATQGFTQALATSDGKYKAINGGVEVAAGIGTGALCLGTSGAACVLAVGLGSAQAGLGLNQAVQGGSEVSLKQLTASPLVTGVTHFGVSQATAEKAVGYTQLGVSLATLGLGGVQGAKNALASANDLRLLSSGADNSTALDELLGGSGGGYSVVPNSLDNLAAPGPVNFMADSDRFFVNVSKRSDVDPNGYFDVVAHGSPNKIQIETPNGPVLVDHRTAARLIQQQPGYNGQNVRLLSCSTGSCDTGFAQNLANKLNVEVQAPSDLLWAYPNGKTVVAPKGLNGLPDLSNTGEIKIFLPKNSQ